MIESGTHGSTIKKTTALRQLSFWLGCSAMALLFAGCAPITQSFEQEAPPVQAGLADSDTELTEHVDSEAEPETSLDETEPTPTDTAETGQEDSLASTQENVAAEEGSSNAAEEAGTEVVAALGKSEVERIADDYRMVFMKVVREASFYSGSPPYDSLEQIEAEFRSVMSPQWAQTLTAFYFYEEDGMVWLIATEAPVWLSHEDPYEIENTGQDVVRVVQESRNEMMGPIRLVLELKQTGKVWLVDRHTVESLEL